ncbi:unnamed protein product, partial [Laminaria digitata]
VILPEQLNERQSQAFDNVKRHFEVGGDIALHQMALGTAGTGKSWLLYALSHLLGGHVKRAAPTGMAAFLIGGSTLHSLLYLPVCGGKALQGGGLSRLQERLTGAMKEGVGGGRYVIIDELLMGSQAQMAWVDRRLREATGKTTVPFGGVSVVMTGAPGQLPPVGGRPLH